MLHLIPPLGVSAVRNYALHLACLRHDLDGWYGRDFDQLPAEALAEYDETLVCTCHE